MNDIRKAQDYEHLRIKNLETQSIEFAHALLNSERVKLERRRSEILNDIHNENTDENQYLEYLKLILERGEYVKDRTGVGTFSTFGSRMVFDLQDRFPLFTTKQIYFKAVAAELLWFLKGDTNVIFLHDNGCHIWDEWADDQGDLGPIYGKQWRDWNGEGIDQIKNAIELLRTDPRSRRIIVSAWNPSQIQDMALPPCHVMFQFYVSGDSWISNKFTLNCQIYQRSGDMFLGVPFNIASYALLTNMMAKVVGMRPGKLIWIGGDTHIYANHVDQVSEQLHRTPYKMPYLELADKESIFDYTMDDIHIHEYKHHPTIKAPVAV